MVVTSLSPLPLHWVSPAQPPRLPAPDPATVATRLTADNAPSPASNPGAHADQSADHPPNPQRGPSTTQQHAPAPGGLSDAELATLRQLKARDTEVHQHEAAHQSAGGSYVGAASFTFTRGPDGQRYAVGGEVPVDTAPLRGKPEETLEKMRAILAAALAPADPSAQDRRVAAKAMQAIAQAQLDLHQQTPPDGAQPAQQAAASRAYGETSGTASALPGARLSAHV